MSATQQVITIDDISAENAPVIYVAGGLNQFLEAVKVKVTGEVPDLTTRKGRERIASLADEILRQEKVREADKAHRIKIMGAAKEALMSMNISEELAKAIVLKIARREVPNVTINF